MSLFFNFHDDRLPPGSFQTPVTPPQQAPGAAPLVQLCINKNWIPFILGALTQLTMNTTWSGTDAEIQAARTAANDLILMFQQAHNECFTSPAGTAGASEDFMLRQNPDNPCELQSSVDGVTWCTWADLSKCTGQAMQPGNTTPNPGPGGCKQQIGIAQFGSRWLLPFPVSTGDVITVTNAVGTWSGTGDLFLPRCPDGNIYFNVSGIPELDACVDGTGHTEPGDPAPTINHDSLIAYDGTNYYDCGPASASTPVMITIPSGISNGNLYFFANTTDTVGFGSVTFDVNYCNNAAATWTASLDLTTNPRGFVQDVSLGNCARGHWVSGSGFESDWCYQAGDNESFRGIVISLSGLAPFNVTQISAMIDYSPASFVLTTEFGFLVRTIDGGNHDVISLHHPDVPTGSNQPVNGFLSASNQTKILVVLDCGSLIGNSDPGGTEVLKSLTISGTGTNPFGGP